MKKHLIGIGGVGMSALATALVKLGCTVTGADRTLGTPNLRRLEALGVVVFPDDGSGVDESVDEVIVSTAIEKDNPGLVRANRLGIPVTHRAKALADALAGHRLVAVVGTCGKSTVTAMLGHLLVEAGLDPFCVNGANVPGWEGAVHFGKGVYAVAEVDESDRSLVAFNPYAAIVTNASADHYSKEEMDEVFDAFVKNCPGPVVDGRKSLEGCGGAGRSALPTGDVTVERVDNRTIKPSSLKTPLCSLLSLSPPRSSLQPPRSRGLEVPIPGRHNRENAILAVTMAMKLGVDRETAFAAMKTFRGVERRLELITAKPSKPSQPLVYDDYAHNPEKLRAMWTTLAEKSPRGICVIWRPHGYTPLRKMMDDLTAMFLDTVRPQDLLLLLPVYDAGGTTDRTIGSDALFARLSAADAAGRFACVADLDAAFTRALALRERFDCFVTCGARDPGLPLLARRLADGFSA